MMLVAGLGFAIYSPLTEDSPVVNLSMGALIIHSVCVILALGCGGWVAGRFTSIRGRSTAWLHGFSVWCAATVGGVLLVTLGAGWMLGGISSLAGSGLSAAGSSVASVAYAALVVILRLSGKRSLAQMNAFDLVVTVSLGSILATMMLSKTAALTEGITALALLLFLQFGITWLSVRIPPIRNLVRSEPSLLYHDHAFMVDTMKKQRVSRDELVQIIRSSGATSLTEVGSVILETNGKFSVLPHSQEKPDELLADVSMSNETNP